MFTNTTNKFWSLFTAGLADVDGITISIQVCMWVGFPPLQNQNSTEVAIRIWRDSYHVYLHMW